MNTKARKNPMEGGKKSQGDSAAKGLRNGELASEPDEELSRNHQKVSQPRNPADEEHGQ